MLRIKDLHCGYRHKSVVEIGSVEILDGSLTFVLGPNGSGKSTFFKTLAGLQAPIQGTIEQGDGAADKISFLPAVHGVQFGVTGHDVMDLFHVSRSRWRSQDAIELLEVDRLLARPIEELSSGEAKRVLLAATLMRPSDVLLLDEPLSHLDWHYQSVSHRLLQRQIDLGRTLVVSAHDFNWCLLFIKSRSLVLSEGRLIANGPTQEALTQPLVQQAFRFRSVLTENPLNRAPLLALAEYDKQPEKNN